MVSKGPWHVYENSVKCGSTQCREGPRGGANAIFTACACSTVQYNQTQSTAETRKACISKCYRRRSVATFLQALKQLHTDYEANGTGVVPLMYEDGQVYDCS